MEQAPPDIDEYIQPSDSALVLNSLVSLSVSHFEIENGGGGDPRSVAIRWEFGENDYFEDKVLEKKFWYRRARDGWTGLVSEPVDIKWKKGKDLTNGLLAMVKRVWDEEQKRKGEKKDELTSEQKALKKKIENTGLAGQSFFAWFGFVGRRISAEESRAAYEREEAKRKRRSEGKAAEEEEEEGKEEDDQEEFELEIFPDGDDLAIHITEDLWPKAITYFSKTSQRSFILHITNTLSRASDGIGRPERRRL